MCSSTSDKPRLNVPLLAERFALCTHDAGAPAFVLELALAEIELGLRALSDPKQSAKAVGALAKIGGGLLRSVMERKVDAALFEGIADLGTLGIEELRRKNSERLSFQARVISNSRGL